MAAKKVAISMPEPMFREMERSRKRGAKASDRSAWIQDAVSERLKREQHEADIAAYIHAYEQFPETEEEIVMAETAARLLFEALDEEDGGYPDAPS